MVMVVFCYEMNLRNIGMLKKIKIKRIRNVAVIQNGL